MGEPEARRLHPLEDRFREIRREEGEVQDTADMFTLLLEPYSERLDRADFACFQHGFPAMGLCERLDQRRVREPGIPRHPRLGEDAGPAASKPCPDREGQDEALLLLDELLVGSELGPPMRD